MFDARDLVINQDIRDYWKKNDIFTDPKDQVTLILRAYTSIDNKIKYLEDFMKDHGNLLIERWNGDINIQDIIDYYRKVIEFIYSDNSQYLKQFFVFDTLKRKHSVPGFEEQEEYSSIGYDGVPDYYYSYQDILKYYEEVNEEDYLIDCVITDLSTKTEVVQYSLFTIKGEISFIYENHNIAGYDYDYSKSKSGRISHVIFDITSSFSYTNKDMIPLYPYKNNTKIALKTNNMKEPLIRYLYDSIDGNGTNYCHFVKRKVKNESDIILLYSIFSYSIFFKQFYNYYDWIMEVKE